MLRWFLIVGILSVLACGGGASSVSKKSSKKAKPTVSQIAQSDDTIPYGPGGWTYEQLSSISQGLRRLPKGSYAVGSDRREEYPDRFPRHNIEVGELLLSQSPVLNISYAAFVVDRDGYNEESFWTKEGWEWKDENNISGPLDWEEVSQDLEDPNSSIAGLPVTGVSLYEAQAFLRSLGCLAESEYSRCSYKSKRYEDGGPLRLPTEHEFEIASSLQGDLLSAGKDGSSEGQCSGQSEQYPWGGELFDPSRLANAGRKAPSGAYSSGISPCVGLLDTKGNVLQWTSSTYKPYPGSAFKVDKIMKLWAVARGSDYEANDAMREISSRTPLPPETRDDRVGFRIAMDDPTYASCVWSDLRTGCPFR